ATEPSSAATDDAVSKLVIFIVSGFPCLVISEVDRGRHEHKGSADKARIFRSGGGKVLPKTFLIPPECMTEDLQESGKISRKWEGQRVVACMRCSLRVSRLDHCSGDQRLWRDRKVRFS